MVCLNPNCCSILAAASLVAQLDVQIRDHITNFYEGWLVCDDRSCANRTRHISVYGKRCLKPDCRGLMQSEVGYLMHYLQAKGITQALQRSILMEHCTPNSYSWIPSLIWNEQSRLLLGQHSKVGFHLVRMETPKLC